MFKKTNIPQLDAFSSPSMMMSPKNAAHLEDSLAWFNQFYRNVTCNVDEEVFRVLYAADKEKGKNGAPNQSISVMTGMVFLKEGIGCSDAQLFENCTYNIAHRRAIGLFNLTDELPTPRTYYNFRARVAEYEATHGVNLFEQCFKKITAAQAKAYKVCGKEMRMDSKLISSNIAFYSRYHLIVTTLAKEVSKETVEKLENQTEREFAKELLEENPENTCYITDSESMGKRLLTVGIISSHILDAAENNAYPLLRKVFTEQYHKDENGNVSVRDKQLVSAKSLQNPNDPDAHYRSKGKQKVKGYSVNISETVTEKPEKGIKTPDLITSVEVKPASAADNTFVKKGVEDTAEVTGQKVEKVHTDGAYQSEDNRKLASEKGFDFIANGIQGKPSRYDLEMDADGILQVTDKITGEIAPVKKVSDKSWKVKVKGKDGKYGWRYFRDKAIERSQARREMAEQPIEERMKRNNVEATIFQYSLHLRGNKTRYRGLFKHTLQAIARCAWINMRRLFLYDLKLAQNVA